MRRVRWTQTAQRELDSLLEWWERHRGPEQAGRVAVSVAEAIRRAAENPELFAWVGSLHEVLEPLPRNVRRVLTRPPRYAIYYRHVVVAADEIQILCIRGGGQLPPSGDELSKNAESLP